MRGQSMETPWRTVQVFISSQAAGVFEVEVDTDTKSLRCSCPVWKKTSTCKHSTFVKHKMKMSNGHYSIQIPTEITEDMVKEASHDPKSFRDLVLKYAKIEVL